QHQAEGMHSHGFGVYHAHTLQPASPTADKGQRPMRNLLLLGISGGLIPCPSALILLLGAVAAGQAGLGLLLVAAFSTGLAAVLTAIGLILVYARHLFVRVPLRGPALRYLPIASALAITVAGGVIAVQAVMSI
ncbi:MAG: sulfite exporter TauE/SafE family protein, partial [Roseiflexaceae bacterium]|nr:sulfite exporter TauE/SafE family protein [Roseiflexaceae bacterium]